MMTGAGFKMVRGLQTLEDQGERLQRWDGVSLTGFMRRRMREDEDVQTLKE